MVDATMEGNLSTRRKLLVVGVGLVVIGVLVLGSAIAVSPAVLGVNVYALLAWILAPLIVTAVLVSVGLSSAVMAFMIPEKFCIECGQPIDLDSKFCKYCGHQYGEKETAAP